MLEDEGSISGHLLVTQRLKSGSVSQDLLNLKGKLQDPTDLFHSKENWKMIRDVRRMSPYPVELEHRD